MTAENYTSTFGGENVSPANLSYVTYEIDGPIQLTWAFESVKGDLVTADKIDINCTLTNATIHMPPANQVTVGQDVLFGNIGVEPFIVADHDGGVICQITSGLEWFIYLTDNGTAAGQWHAVQFGAATSAANAAALAGAGLKANLTKLDQNLLTTALTASYAVTAADRATVLQNNGGGVTYTLPDAAVVTDGWFVYVVNLGDGNLLLSPVGGDTIDEAPNKTLAPGESLILLSDGSNFQTVGYGRSLVTSVTGVAINAAGAGTLALTPTQVAAQVQDFTGTLTGNRRIEYGASVGYWFIYNHTTPATPHTMTMATNGIDPGVVVPQGAYSIIRSNGTTMAVSFSSEIGTVSLINTTTDLTGGPITTTGTLGLSNTGVTAGTYGAVGPPIRTPIMGVDIKGRITAASSQPLGTAAGLNTGTGPGTIPLLDAGGNLPSQNGGMQPGDVIYSIALTKPGFVFANGTTIGSAASGGSQRANADTANLFGVIWLLSSAQFPIFTSTGAASTRGANAAADFNANKRITLPDLRGTVIAGLDNAGGAASAARLSSTLSSTIVGARGGTELVTLLNSQIPLHVHPNTITYSEIPHSHTFSNASFTDIDATVNGTGDTHYAEYAGNGSYLAFGNMTLAVAGISVSITNVNQTGGGGSHTNVQNTMVMNPFLKL